MIKLWENGTPYFNPAYEQEEPSLVPYLVESDHPTGAVIVCPGGGYCMRAFHEGEPIAQRINQGGISAFVLNYRVAPYQHPVMLTDVTRAVRYVRYHAKEWNIDPEKIGVLGFSAGGHLAVTAIEHFDYGKPDGDDIDAVSSRPNAGILGYPVVSFVSPYTHVGSRENLIGKNPDHALMESLSGECSVREDTPPVFIWHTAEDDGVPVQNSLQLAIALREKHIPCELHIFPYGSHGLGLALENENVRQWSSLLINWLKLYKF